MKQDLLYRIKLSEIIGSRAEQLECFALLNLGIVESLTRGTIGAAEAAARFYHAENCLYVRRNIGNRQAVMIMSRGVQLPDIFDSLPREDAQREFYNELEVMRALCLGLLKKRRHRSRAAMRAESNKGALEAAQ